MSGSARAGTISREAYLRAVNPEALQCALSRARPGHLCFSVDKDLHGRRQTGQNSIFWVISGLAVNHPRLAHLTDRRDAARIIRSKRKKSVAKQSKTTKISQAPNNQSGTAPALLM